MPDWFWIVFSIAVPFVIFFLLGLYFDADDRRSRTTDYTYTPIADADYDASACVLSSGAGNIGSSPCVSSWSWNDVSPCFCGDAGPSTSSSMLEMPTSSCFANSPCSSRPVLGWQHHNATALPEQKSAYKTCHYCGSKCEPDTLRCPGCGAQDWEKK